MLVPRVRMNPALGTPVTSVPTLGQRLFHFYKLWCPLGAGGDIIHNGYWARGRRGVNKGATINGDRGRGDRTGDQYEPTQ